ncbi:ribosome recycling factor [Pseudobacteriovorax antillogorgiicola]|uniref:Ribosome-recycling factor n=1 Tax=Pseudobacteriovorax antillogorgiicola TaxID=1513793 RepID=A0A1Y6C5T4_9BACT|nr:ribosome recycling factor [Pseudobacteriovorax antillogorgiicola]TCS49400.1 ribosome recycling factor [Pseudobacteriovorax antillogorgiicola]SMF47082.1 ribosome recycling factor [Pseudobacteriovorax antillogorgiicola]
MDDVVNKCQADMEKRLKGFETDLTRVRTGRASISVLDGVKVEYYGTPTPLNQVGTLSTPDARTIVISPFEKNLIQEIEKSIMKADLGLQPTNDGVVIRIPIPQLTEERRKDIVKQLKKMAEDAKVSIRHIRRDSNDAIKKAEKNKELTEDDSKQLQQDVQKHTDAYIKKVDDRLAVKEKEVMKV